MKKINKNNLKKKIKFNDNIIKVKTSKGFVNIAKEDLPKDITEKEYKEIKERVLINPSPLELKCFELSNIEIKDKNSLRIAKHNLTKLKEISKEYKDKALSNLSKTLYFLTMDIKSLELNIKINSKKVNNQ